jgi:NAD(P)-dependent dehydrogenase (short-subunit alcohol dehydrogenase family)
MSLQGKTIVIAGATGVVGSGIVRRALDAGATVVGISRSADKLKQLRSTLGIGPSEPFVEAVGDFNSEEAAGKAKDAVGAALRGGEIDHVVSNVGFVVVDKAATATSLDTARRALDDGFFNTWLVAKAFLPALKSREGSSFTMVSGGLAHGLGFPGSEVLWLASAKNAIVNALTHGLAAETTNDKVRVNTVCIHFGVAPIGGNKNQLGMNAEHDTLHLAPAFLALADGNTRGQVVCLNSWADVGNVK